MRVHLKPPYWPGFRAGRPRQSLLCRGDMGSGLCLRAILPLDLAKLRTDRFCRILAITGSGGLLWVHESLQIAAPTCGFLAILRNRRQTIIADWMVVQKGFEPSAPTMSR
jgi:hypothetical protein